MTEVGDQQCSKIKQENQQVEESPIELIPIPQAENLKNKNCVTV